MRCFHLLVCLTLALTFSVTAEAGGSYGSYGSYGSGGSSGGASYGSSGGSYGGSAASQRGYGSRGGGLLSRMHARFAARQSGSSGGSYGGPSGGSSGGTYAASYAPSGSSGGYSGGGLFSRLRAHVQAKRARHAARRAARTGYYASGYSSGGYSNGGYSSGGASSGGSSGGYYSPAVNVTPLSYGSSGGYASPMIQSNYPVDGYSVDGYPIESYPSEYYPSDNFVPANDYSHPTDGESMRGDSTGNGSDPASDAKSKESPDAKNGGDSVIDDSARHEAQKPTLDDDTALLTVAVPVDSARVTVNGRDTTSNGTVRQFMSRGLKPGYVYAYEVVVTYDVDGQEQTDTKTIKLRPGDAERLVFQQDAAATAEEVTPAAEAVDTDSVDAEVNADAAADTTETVVQLHVPANAVVTLAGNETKGFGRVRTFRTTQLAPGQNWTDYTVSVSATVNGRSIRQERTINVAAGSTVELEFDVTAGTLAMR